MGPTQRTGWFSSNSKHRTIDRKQSRTGEQGSRTRGRSLHCESSSVLYMLLIVESLQMYRNGRNWMQDNLEERIPSVRTIAHEASNLLVCLGWHPGPGLPSDRDKNQGVSASNRNCLSDAHADSLQTFAHNLFRRKILLEFCLRRRLVRSNWSGVSV